MLEGKRVAVVVPAYDEEALVVETLRGIPEFVDRCTSSTTPRATRPASALESWAIRAIEVIRHERNRASALRSDRLPARARGRRRRRRASWPPTTRWTRPSSGAREPVARGEVDYAKANRLVSGEAWKIIPHTRYLGNAVLSLLTKIASGYWHVADSQAGYTAISREALQRLDLDRLYPRYGFPNDMLVHLNVQNARVRDVPSRPIYHEDGQSGIGSAR